MRQPLSRETPVNARRFQKWIGDYGGYRYQVTEHRLNDWLNQFKDDDRIIAARILDSVDFVGHERIANAYRDCLAALPGWDKAAGRRKGKWRFVAFSGSAGESGDSMLHEFRLANGLDSKRFDSLFILRRDLLQENLGADDTVVFVDDFSGTGRQICTAWEETFRELLVGGPTAYLILAAAGDEALKNIRSKTELSPHVGFRLTNRDRFFHEDCGHFTAEEKRTILKYCEKLQPENPKGMGDCGYAIVFCHRCPNNSIPVLWCHTDAWWAIFPRSRLP